VPDLRILIVDDFEDFRRFICSTLEQRTGFHVVGQASDGWEAVRLAKELQPDLILLDIGLPKLNGLEAAKRIRGLAPQARLLFISQESSSEVIGEALRSGALGYVHKPSTLSDLLPAIEAVFRGEPFVSRAPEFNDSTRTSHRHEVQFYSADWILIECFTDRIAAALRGNNAAVVLATKSHREGLVQRLKAEGFDVDRAILGGTYVSLDAADMLSRIMVDGVLDRARVLEGLTRLIASAATAAKKEDSRVALCGECVGLLSTLGNMNAAIRLERVGNDLISTKDVDVTCAYPLGAFRHQGGDSAFKLISAEHTPVYSE
jgi:DNA-binding NarL/FixJ family response regulator